MITLKVNGTTHKLDIEPETPLLWVLRDELGLTGTKFGCGIAQCGACTVHVNGEAMRSCVRGGWETVNGASIVTIEGLAKDSKHPVQQAWLAEDVPQCGYCQSGQIMAAVAFLKQIPQADRRRHRRQSHRHLPLRHLSAHPARHPPRRGADQGLREDAMDGNNPLPAGITRRGFVVTSLTATGGLAIGMAFPGLAKAAMIGTQPWSKEPPSTKSTPGPRNRARRRRDLPLRRISEMGQGQRHRARHDRRRGTRMPTGPRSRSNTPRPTATCASNDVYGRHVDRRQPSGVRTSCICCSRPAPRARERLISRGRQALGAWRPTECDGQGRQGRRTRPPAATLGYGALAADAAKITARPGAGDQARPSSSSSSASRRRGSTRRSRSTARRKFGIDTRIPDMVYAAVSVCPVFGGKVKSVDDCQDQGPPRHPAAW